jgi:hypothetical protein
LQARGDILDQDEAWTPALEVEAVQYFDLMELDIDRDEVDRYWRADLH